MEEAFESEMINGKKAKNVSITQLEITGKKKTTTTLTNRFKAVFFWVLGTNASVKDCAALLNSTCIHTLKPLASDDREMEKTSNAETLIPRIFLH